MADLIYPVRPGLHDAPAHLRYSLRTAYHHLPHDRVFIVGHAPSWLNLDLVHHIPSPQLPQRYANRSEPFLRFANQRANLEAVFASDVSEHAIWMNDDFYALTDITSTIPFYHRGSLTSYLSNLGNGEYAEGQRFCLKLLESWGYPDPDNYCVHAPLPVSVSRLSDLMTIAWSEGLQGGFLRALYPVGQPGNHVEITDPKIKTATDLPEISWSWVSSSQPSWDNALGDLIRNRYWRPSPYELSR